MLRKGNLAVFESSNISETGDISTPSLISACFFTVGIQAQPLICTVYYFNSLHFLSLSPFLLLSLPTGHHASINEKGATAIMTVELDKEKGPQVRVVQGTEHPAFLQLFNGSMIVLHGKSDNNDISLCNNGKTFSNK